MHTLTNTLKQVLLLSGPVCVTNPGTSKYIMQLLTEIKGETDKNRIVVGDLNIHWQLQIDHPNRKSIKKYWP